MANSFYDKGNNVIIISLNNEIINSPANENIIVYSLKLKKSFVGFFRAILTARKILKKYSPDVIHSHMFHANIFSRILRLIYPKVPLICTAHNTNEGGRLRMFLYRITDFLATISTNVSQEAVESFVQKGAVKRGRMIAFYNGIDTNLYKYSPSYRINKRKELNLNDEDVLLLAVGRLTDAKNYKNMLKALQIVIENKRVHLAIIGNGPDRNKLIEYASRLGITQNVHWLGVRFDVYEWMSAMDLYVMSSSWEGMPLVICEAMSCGGIVVATDCGGVKEIVGNSGFIVPKNDSKALSKSICDALALTEEERVSITSSARDRIERYYSLNIISGKWLSLYDEF
ncbi:glycosyltransferase [Escherichia coli]